MEWTEEKTLKLIESYKDYELLWNPKHLSYHNKIKKHKAWEEIAKEFQCQVPEIKKKMDSLLSSFRKERMKCITKSGCGRDEVYKSTWFFFNYMKFLLDKFQPRTTYDTNTISENESSASELIETQNDESNTEPIEVISEDISKEHNVAENVANKTIFSNISRSKKRSFSIEEKRVSKAYDILKSTVQTSKQKDNSDIFGDYVARKHRKYNIKTQSYVEHQVSNILFQADMETYEHAIHLTRQSTISSDNRLDNRLDRTSSSSSSLSSSPQILSQLQSLITLPIQTLNNDETYVISDN